MKKKFKSRKHFSFFKFFICFIFTFVLCLILRFFLCLKVMSFDVNSLLNVSNFYSSIDFSNYIMSFLSTIMGVNINKPNTILQNVMYYHDSNHLYFVSNDSISVDDSNYDSAPLVYIYNTHDTEEYSDGYSVFDASFYLRDKLKDFGINSIVEENRTSDIRNSNGWNYNLSYKASRINLERVKSENPSVKIFIDLHRDSVGRSSTVASINDESFAKVLFVVGQEHQNYLDNLFFTQSIDDSISNMYPGLSKGILEKSGPGVNGIYNQDIDSSVILMEVGGCENSSLEVKNTLGVVANILKEKLNE